MKRILCLICLAALLLFTGCATAEAFAASPALIVQYDRAVLDDWTPCYSLTPGVLLTLSHPEGLVSVSTLSKEERTPEAYLSGRLDAAAQTLVVSDAQLLAWDDPFDGDGRLLSFSYTYMDGDEPHLCRIQTASRSDLLIELSVDVWGEEAEYLLESAEAAFSDGRFAVDLYDDVEEMRAVLSDVAEDDGETYVRLNDADAQTDESARFYCLAPDAIVLFPNPDSPSLLFHVAPDMPSLIDAILTYEASSDSPSSFQCVLSGESIVYMEYATLP